MSDKIIIYTDGGSRGNPGPAGIGGVITLSNGSKSEFSEYIGDSRTNNEAEYEALIVALEKTKKVIGKTMAKQAILQCFLDSELIVKQLNHEYRLRDERIQRYFIQIWNLMLDYGSVEFAHVRREFNKDADALVNKALDEQASRMF